MADFLEDLEKEIEYHRCRGCECFGLELVDDELKWVCELDECYMPGESYNPKWKLDSLPRSVIDEDS